mgnify:CR=1 FL=1
MTLIAGVKLPKGILLVSDTRETKEFTDEIASDLKRKITLIAPGCYVATSGQESTSLMANILRNCLYNGSVNKSLLGQGKSRRRVILDLYDQVNNVFRLNHKFNEPIGHILVADYNEEDNEFSLLESGGLEGFKSFNKVERTGLIGASQVIRNNTKERIERLLNQVSEEKLNEEFFFEPLAKDIQRIIQEETRNYVWVGENMYCTYLTVKDTKPACSVFFLRPDGKYKPINPQDNSEFLTVPE